MDYNCFTVLTIHILHWTESLLLFSVLRHVSGLRPFSVFLYTVRALAARFAAVAVPGLLGAKEGKGDGTGSERYGLCCVCTQTCTVYSCTIC